MRLLRAHVQGKAMDMAGQVYAMGVQCQNLKAQLLHKMHKAFAVFRGMSTWFLAGFHLITAKAIDQY